MKNKTSLISDFERFSEVFLEENAKHNLISKNDEKFLYEKHFFDSLAIGLFFDKYKIRGGSILDIGCGGGFPCVPISMKYPAFNVTGIDSTRKKINSVNEIKNKLHLDNLNLIWDRVENIKNLNFDIVVSRAVADLAKLSEYALPLIKKNGYLIAYKSKKSESEINDAGVILKKYNAKITDIINYTLPTDDMFERKLICIQKS